MDCEHMRMSAAKHAAQVKEQRHFDESRAALMSDLAKMDSLLNGSLYCNTCYQLIEHFALRF